MLSGLPHQHDHVFSGEASSVPSRQIPLPSFSISKVACSVEWLHFSFRQCIDAFRVGRVREGGWFRTRPSILNRW